MTASREPADVGPEDISDAVGQHVLTTRSGRRVEVRGCDLFELRDGKVTRKDTFLKQVVPPRV
jgi:ketosteroid isomerase-like protein